MNIFHYLKLKLKQIEMPALAFIFFFLIETARISSEISNKIIISNTLDLSWTMDIIQRFKDGFIAGRDFIFTYGPLYQVLISTPEILLKIPSYSSFIISQIILRMIFLFFIFTLSKALIKNKKYSFIFFLFLSSLSFFYADSNALLRMIFPFIFSVYYMKLHDKNNETIYKKLIAYSIPSIIGLYIFDLFLSCIIFIVIYNFFIFLRNKNFSLVNYLQIVIKELLIIAIIECIISFIISGNFNYLLDSLATISEYKYLMNIPLSFNSYYLSLIIPFLLVIVFLQKARKRKINSVFLTLSITAIISTKTALIRTDDGHILQAIMPSLFVLIYLVYNKIKLKNFFIFLSVGLIIIIIIQNINGLSIDNIAGLNKLFSKKTNFFDLYKLSENYYLINDTSDISRIIQKSKSTLVYPYDNFLLNINNKSFNTYSLQFYAWSNSRIEEKTVQILSKNPPEKIIYMIDGSGTFFIDNISNLSRNPIINEWIINNYSVEKDRKKYLILKYDKKGKKFADSGCKLYEIDIKDKSIFFENLIKPSTYYLENDRFLRLPVTKNKKILIYEDYKNSSEMKKLIDSNLKKDTKKGEKKKIIKKFAIPFKTIEVNNSVNCY